MNTINYFLEHVLHINLGDYPPIQVFFLTLGTFFWIVVYRDTILNMRRYKLVEIPMIVAALDLSWEFCWGFLLENDYAPFFKWACIVWFFMDAYINYYTLKHGTKLVTNSWIKKNYLLIYLFILIGGGFITYFMRYTHQDDGIGAISAFFINLVISSTYIYQLLTYPHYRYQEFSYRIAWAKFLGTGFIALGCALHYPDNHFLHTMSGMVFIMDMVYIYLFKTYVPENQ